MLGWPFLNGVIVGLPSWGWGWPFLFGPFGLGLALRVGVRPSFLRFVFALPSQGVGWVVANFGQFWPLHFWPIHFLCCCVVVGFGVS